MDFIMQSGVSPSSLVKQAQLWPSPRQRTCRLLDGVFVKDDENQQQKINQRKLSKGNNWVPERRSNAEKSPSNPN